MSSRSDFATILVVEGDVVLGQVLSRVLRREGLTIVHAANAVQARELADQYAPRVALVDCSLRAGNGLELAKELHTRSSGLPVIVLVDDPLAVYEDPIQPRFARVLSKSVDLHELRRAVDAALSARSAEREAQSATKAQVSKPERLMSFAKELSMRIFFVKVFKPAGFVLLILIVMAGLAVVTGAVPAAWQPSLAAAMGGVRMPWRPPEDKPPAPPKPVALAVELVKGQPHTLAVPEEVRKALGIRKGNTDLIAEAKKPTKTRPLVMPGSTALDPTRLFRIRARFAPSPSSAEVIQIGQVPEDRTQSGKVETVFREIRTGDHVNKGDLLAVFHSVDVGNMKNNLIDAIYQLKLDEEILQKAEAHADAVPEVFILNARRAVQGDINAINRSVSTLKTWGISAEDIRAVRDEAENVKKRHGKHDPEKDALWARVEIKAPDDGIIIERNLARGEIVVDNTTNLFQIAQVNRLFVSANVPEDDLPALQALPSAQRRWTVRTVGSPPVQGFISDIGYLIDPNQHTAIVKGYIENPNETLRGGQFISATVELPPPADVTEVPIDAVIDDGQQCVVMVQTDPKNHPEHFTMRRVQVTHRFDKIAFVRSKPFAKGEQRTPEEAELGLLPREPLLPGERILRTGVGELKATLLDKESESNRERKDGKDR